ncbi:hypothetical protein NKR23_g4215 [Pleurostoma richardsiae]|uniref:Uncharacterized protein n=1 Tax=Pleurostoma richardsiae TaxID=41990 RepID=A0AA38VVF9_9PEZI|nr:hypothetical protein NKR23_g4215 [Pleurostoma richardsiae]
MKGKIDPVTEGAPGVETPEQIYHTTLTVIDYHEDNSGSTQTVWVLGTHSTLEAAKAFTRTALQTLGYAPEDFAAYEVKPAGADETWPHGDGVLVYAKAFAGQVFLVGLQTSPNNDQLLADGKGGVVLPDGVDRLHYVLQTTVDYNQDRTGAAQSTEVEGCYAHRSAALEAARAALVGGDDDVKRSDFAQYDERDEPDMSGEWPFGEDVVVHAVAQSGENYTVAIRTVPGAHQKHHKKEQQKH